MEEWGRTMKHKYGKPHDGVDFDFTLTHLGYSTDNGCP